jgi:UDP-GlcNAc:undecaprenyl-phosphate GlcNAc-1-phosphate transferase
VIAQLNYPQLWMLILAWFVADLATPLVIRLCRRIGALDHPRGHKTHREPTPILGGLAVYAAFAAALFSILRFPDSAAHTDILAIVLGGFGVMALGMIDSFRPLWAPAKLAVLVLATLLLARFGVRITLTGLPAADLALTVFWVAGVASAMNAVDNMDGAAAGLAAVASLWILYVAWYTEPYGQPRVSYVAVALLGACLGFLRYNFRPARIFLGDSGSLLLGFLLAALTVQAGWARGDAVKAVAVPCAILCVPLYDITLTTILRVRRGVVRGPVEAIVYCGRDHLAHRLIALGLSPREAVLVLYLFGMIGGAVGVILARPEVGPRLYVPVLAVSAVLLAALGWILDRAPVYESAADALAVAPSAPAAGADA